MGIKILKIILLIVLYIFLSQPVYGLNLAEDSAKFSNSIENNYDFSEQSIFYKKLAIKHVLEEYNSPLIDSLDQFIKICYIYNIDCYLLPAITGLESTFGHYIYPNSYNPFGWGGGYYMFNNWSDAIASVGKNIKINYIDKGAKTVDQIGKIYSESPTWAVRVNWFIKKFQSEEEKVRLSFIKNKLKL